MAPSHHDVLKALGPISWGQVPQDDLKQFLDDIFADSQTVVESIPSPQKQSDSSPSGRARSKTDSAVEGTDLKASLALRPSQEAIAKAASLRKEWKEVKVNPRENPLDIAVYKLSAKDGKGAWFARRSTHEGLDFEKWKLGLEREFYESMAVQGAPGSGNIRGIGAETRIEHRTVDNVGELDVFQLSAQFPGPTSPRDFITLFLTSDFSHKTAGDSQPLRQFMIVSKPCEHPEAPPRQGIIRGQYESVEIIREVLVTNGPAKRSASSADLARDHSKSPGPIADQPKLPGDRTVAIEWLMVTRSDPGGSVPRFMIERGTPPGIVGDAGKFLDWIKAKDIEQLRSGTKPDVIAEAPSPSPMAEKNFSTPALAVPEQSQQPPAYRGDAAAEDTETQSGQENSGYYSGLYGMITGVFNTATSVATGLRRQLVSPGESFEKEEDPDPRAPASGKSDEEKERDQDSLEDNDLSSEISSIHSFASALEKRDADEMSQDSMTGSRSDESKQAQTHERELRKIQERRRKIDEKVARMQERMAQRRQNESQKDAAAQAKAREKHERELAKQEAKYRKEVRRLEEKRENEQRKADEKRRKAAEREDKGRLTLELNKARAERDVAQKQIQLLRDQVGELQAQNTELVARLGRLGGLEGGEAEQLPSASLKDRPAGSGPGLDSGLVSSAASS